MAFSPPKELGAALRAARLRRRLRPAEVEKLLGWRAGTLAAVEAGDDVPYGEAAKLLTLYGMNSFQQLERSGSQEAAPARGASSTPGRTRRRAPERTRYAVSTAGRAVLLGGRSVYAASRLGFPTGWRRPRTMEPDLFERVTRRVGV